VKNREDVASLALRTSQEQAALDRKQRCRGRYKCSRCGVPKVRLVLGPQLLLLRAMLACTDPVPLLTVLLLTLRSTTYAS
jgi:hypothetical protein